MVLLLETSAADSSYRIRALLGDREVLVDVNFLVIKTPKSYENFEHTVT